MFVPSLRVKAPPRLEQERTLILWDAAGHRQHFVREVRFTNTGELPFGFIVPTPSRAEVGEVKTAPFDQLETRFGHTLLETPGAFDGRVGGKGSGEGFGRGAPGGAAPAVTVLEKKRIGDFTSFVLSATDAKALADWLKKNQFRATEAGQKWIERYVRRGFFFVALRYEGKKQKKEEAAGLVSRTLRLSFDSPLPYYPYEEPTDAPVEEGRELLVWLVSSGLHLPLATRDTGSGPRVARPWSEGRRHGDATNELRSLLGSELASFVPESATVQTFGDFKAHRRGFSDAFLVPDSAEGCDATCARTRRSLIPIVDPSLAEASLLDEKDLVVSPPAPRAPRKGSSGSAPAIATGSPLANALSFGSGFGCALRRGVSSAPSWVAIGLLGFAFGVRRRRRVLRRAGLVVACAGLAFACGSPPPPPAPPPPPGVSAATPAPSATIATGEATAGPVLPGKLDAYELPTDGAARQKAWMRLLSGHTDDKLVPVLSTPLERGIGHASNPGSGVLSSAASIEERCASDERVEGTLEYQVSTAPDGNTQAVVRGALPNGVLGCVESMLTAAGPRIGRDSERGFLSLGSTPPAVIALRRRIKDRDLVSVRPALGGTQIRKVRSSASPGLPVPVVDRIMRQQFGRFRACYEASTHPAPKGEVTLKFDIGPGGDVLTMAASTADVAGAAGLCMGNAARTLSFPSPEGGHRVKVSFTLGFARDK